jgi:hypothetical protein
MNKRLFALLLLVSMPLGCASYQISKAMGDHADLYGIDQNCQFKIMAYQDACTVMCNGRASVKLGTCDEPRCDCSNQKP